MLPRFHHLLVPIDLTPRNRPALDIAFELAADNRARVSLLHVTQMIESHGEIPDREMSTFYDRIRQRLLVEMEALTQRFDAAGIPVEGKVHVGQPLQDILEFAASHAVDLIIMSSHPVDEHNLLRSWGTLSYKVSVACKCPILLVK